MKRLGELAEYIGAQLIGDPEMEISNARSTHCATQRDITFVSAEKHLNKFLSSDSCAAVVSNRVDVSAVQDQRSNCFLVVEDAEASFVELVKLFRPVQARKRIGISPRSIISESAEIAEDVDIYPGAFIGENVKLGCGAVIHANVSILDNAIVGANTVVFPNVTIYENCVVGSRCILHAGSVIGAYGFGYRSGETHQLTSQLGNVVIGDEVEIGSNSTIDRGTYDSTTIGTGTKIDNQVMIGHNCQIGKHNLLCSQVGIAGSCSTGDYVIMAGQVGIGDHLTIGNKAILAAQSGVMHDLKGGQTYMGSPAVRARDQMRYHALYTRLPEMRKQLRSLLQEIEVHRNETAAGNEAA